MPVVNKQGLKIYDKSDLRYKQQVSAARALREKRKAKRERADAEHCDNVSVYLKKPPPSLDQTVQEWIDERAYNREGKFTRTDEGAFGNMVNGFCKNRPSDLSEDEWEQEEFARSQNLNQFESQIDSVLASIGYYATISQSPITQQVWLTDLWYDPESRREEGRLVRAIPAHEKYEGGIGEILARVGLKSIWNPGVNAYLIEPGVLADTIQEGI